MVKVVFCKWGYDKEIADEIGDCYILTPDNWDDDGYKTYFKVNMYKDGENYGEFGRKILFQNQGDIASSSSFLESLLGRNKFIDMIEIKEKYHFISLGYEYQELKKIFNEYDDHIEILRILNDVIYLENKEPQNELLRLKYHPAFEKSLRRDQSSKKVLEEVKELLFGVKLDENRFDFEFSFELNNENIKYHFNFNAKEELPHRINVLIGKNGSGKSQSLLAISEYLLNNQLNSVDKHPSFIANMMLFAYNPYENFVVPRRKRKYAIDYKYLGLKRPKQILDIGMNQLLEFTNLYNMIQKLTEDDITKLEEDIDTEIFMFRNHHNYQKVKESMQEIAEKYNILEVDLSENWSILSETVEQNIVDISTPQYMLFSSFKDIYKKDKNNLSHTIQIDDNLYRNKTFEYINKAFSCDAIALKFLSSVDTSSYSNKGFKINEEYLILDDDRSKYTLDINFEEFENKLYFFNNEELIFLSSGQQTFVDLVINILSLIKPNSLILIDEPENTLHPNLEVDFMRILQSILNDFDSFAIIATHSATIVREVPSEFVHVIKLNESNQPVISKPSIKTFGADIGTITNYIFDDIFKDEKPFENWFLEEKVKYETFDEFEEKYRAILNYDFLLYCKNSWNLQK
jgi:energy-coupling factor transporter ATP-binding protein EcfA2